MRKLNLACGIFHMSHVMALLVIACYLVHLRCCCWLTAEILYISSAILVTFKTSSSPSKPSLTWLWPSNYLLKLQLADLCDPLFSIPLALCPNCGFCILYARPSRSYSCLYPNISDLGGNWGVFLLKRAAVERHQVRQPFSDVVVCHWVPLHHCCWGDLTQLKWTHQALVLGELITPGFEFPREVTSVYLP